MVDPHHQEDAAPQPPSRPRPPGEYEADEDRERDQALPRADGGVEDVPAVELTERQEVERGGEEAQPGGEGEGVEVEHLAGAELPVEEGGRPVDGEATAGEEEPA